MLQLLARTKFFGGASWSGSTRSGSGHARSGDGGCAGPGVPGLGHRRRAGARLVERGARGSPADRRQAATTPVTADPARRPGHQPDPRSVRPRRPARVTPSRRVGPLRPEQPRRGRGRLMASFAAFGKELTGEKSIDSSASRSSGTDSASSSVPLADRSLRARPQPVPGVPSGSATVGTPRPPATSSVGRGQLASTEPEPRSQGRHQLGADKTSKLKNDRERAMVAALAKAYGVSEDQVSLDLHRLQLGPNISKKALGRPDRLPDPGLPVHRALLPHVDDGRGRDRGAAARPAHHGRDLRLGRVEVSRPPSSAPDHPRYSLYDTVVVFDKVPENTGTSRRQRSPRTPRPPTSRSTKRWSARSTPRSSRCCRSPGSW